MRPASVTRGHWKRLRDLRWERVSAIAKRPSSVTRRTLQRWRSWSWVGWLNLERCSREESEPAKKGDRRAEIERRSTKEKVIISMASEEMGGPVSLRRLQSRSSRGNFPNRARIVL